MCARNINNARMKYVSSIIVYFISLTFRRVSIFIIETRITYKNFHVKKYDPGPGKKNQYYEKAKNPGGVAA